MHVQSIKEEIKKEKLDENILMLGFRTDIDDLIASCDVGVLMSYREGLPKNIMELMAGKKPVIGTDIRGIRDLVIDGCNGFLVKVGDSEDTANKIELLKSDKDMLVEFSENAYKFIEFIHRPEIYAQLADVLETPSINIPARELMKVEPLFQIEDLKNTQVLRDIHDTLDLQNKYWQEILIAN